MKRHKRTPTVTTSGGRTRQTRLSTLARRWRGVLGVAITSRHDGLADVTFAMRNGDTIAAVAPHTLVAMDWLSGATKLGTRTPVTIDGIAARGSKAWHEIEMERLPEGDMRESWAIEALRQARKLWLQAAYHQPELVHAVLVGAWARIVRDHLDWRGGYMAGRVVEAMMDAASDAMGGYGVEAIRSEESNAGSYYGDIVATYVNMGDTYSPTLLFEAETHDYVATSWGDWVERYEAEGGTVR